MQHSVFDCLPVFVVMDNAGLKSLRAAWLKSVEKVGTPKIWLRLCFAWKMIEQNIIQRTYGQQEPSTTRLLKEPLLDQPTNQPNK